jgi:hypothetical protein
VALIPNNLLGTTHAQTLGPRNPGPAARDIRQTMTSHPELQKFREVQTQLMGLRHANPHDADTDDQYYNITS